MSPCIPFAAYLNGILLTSDGTVANPAWNATTSSRSDSLAVTPKSYNVTASRSQLRAGTNILAIHGVNAGAGSSDFLLQAQLLATVPVPAGTRVFWRIVPQ